MLFILMAVNIVYWFILGDLYALVDHFLSLHQSELHHRSQSVIVLNEIIKYHITPPSQQVSSSTTGAPSVAGKVTGELPGN